MKKVIILDTWFFEEYYDKDFNPIDKINADRFVLFVPIYTLCEFLKSDKKLLKKRATYIKKFFKINKNIVEVVNEKNLDDEDLLNSIEFLIEKPDYSFTDIKIIEIIDSLRNKGFEIYILTGDKKLKYFLIKKGVKDFFYEY
ncbi:hypothetical protein [Sulfurihydrogenibium sp.]|uniref:hypothetical protein n=1 Tax=Sulfurihydrogenibium sp. TaxID=2053621 RepID=UPI00261FA99A|nr:hypothetical protein [Sulfurihydrogenibium sp.]